MKHLVIILSALLLCSNLWGENTKTIYIIQNLLQ